MRTDDIGVMSCNPAFGGLGKGHLVREIDALGGLMGRAADFAAIQYRLLNRRKGPAVQGPRVQADRERYAVASRAILDPISNLTVIEGEVVDFDVIGDRIVAVELRDGMTVRARAFVLTSGTFLGGKVFVGDEIFSAGRMGADSANRLADRLRELVPSIGRLKTGTPPRLRATTIAWDRLDQQPSDDDPTFMSFQTDHVQAKQVSCGITHTNERTHDIIRENIDRSAMYGGLIDGVGPRYCPSIEDKVMRFAEKSSHQIFLEPEGLTSDLVYPNGISTSLPADIQVDYVRSIEGLETAEIVQPGYAVEYDYCDPRGLSDTLRLHGLANLFLAGQINGTTGYEEAGAQGLLAGLNAARLSIGDDAPITISRSEGYIGVMIDDLVTRGVTEPYRMFTSRAEYRLSLRADNADRRLTPLGIEWGCVGEDRREAFEDKVSKIDDLRREVSDAELSDADAAELGIPATTAGGRRRTVNEALRQQDVPLTTWIGVHSPFADARRPIVEAVRNDAIYENYLPRQQRDISTLQREEAREIPTTIDYRRLDGLTTELRDRLSRVRPRSMGQLMRIEGVTPAAQLVVLAAIGRLVDRDAS